MATDDKGLDANVYAEGVDEKNGNAGDRLDMYRMGKAQEMRVSNKNTLVMVYLLSRIIVLMGNRRETFASCPSWGFP